ncbi:MAG: class I SAM-dependent methyltransferase [Desulfarculus sp.]|nr:class I SAM-dependent methyltransferase [Pseudomonadota bacterium]MBV1714637.1 class I SAM-dependent methyltransferase [Desulfarculus sp.]MBU4576830.1 class I SAM-dependent methyltransferase [Pseudomonadota bacterium]MBU4599973.1 class I SAM-dependent methyltransferase [Pseudomonadota bacterium]MBV1740174.1 class I SAM-dependent methyltransferase [Desulfarculus sp.]
MSGVDPRGAAGLVLEMTWQSPEAAHRELMYAPADLWGDMLPPRLLDALKGLEDGRSVELELSTAESVPDRSTDLVRTVPLDQFAGGESYPRLGRFYPRYLLTGVPGVSPHSNEPFRCLAAELHGLSADLNHPLAGRKLKLKVTVEQAELPPEKTTGQGVDWMARLCAGPGMQARAGGKPTDFLGGDALLRDDEVPDAVFYDHPRLVGHLDSQASANVAVLYGGLIPPGSRVLDLMSSFQSHLPPRLELAEVVGLGLNRAEMEANPQVGKALVHDLNQEPVLPFEDESFDAVICTVSVEYLTQPREVFLEAARVLRPGGVFAVAFSNRFFPPKAVHLWKELHDFEKLGLVLDYFMESGAFKDLGSLSQRGWPRPEDDRHYGEYPNSDPIYAVWGSRA